MAGKNSRLNGECQLSEAGRGKIFSQTDSCPDASSKWRVFMRSQARRVRMEICAGLRKQNAGNKTPPHNGTALHVYGENIDAITSARPKGGAARPHTRPLQARRLAYVLSLHADYCFQHCIDSCNSFRVGLEAALGRDHVHELAREVNV